MLSLIDDSNSVKGTDLKTYKARIRGVTIHLKKQHKLLDDGHYLSLGVAFGLIFGTAFSNPGIGLCIGIAVGAVLDQDAKKKGRII